MFSSKNAYAVNRRYQTISEFLGAFAGVSKFISLVCGIFVHPFLYITTLKYILNKIYAFPAYAKNQKVKKIKKQKKEKSSKHQMIENIETVKSVEFLQSKRKTAEQNLGISTKPLTINTSGNLNQQLFTEVEQIENVKLSETTGFKKNLKDDSFVLEHFSEKCITLPKEELPKKSETIASTNRNK